MDHLIFWLIKRQIAYEAYLSAERLLTGLEIAVKGLVFLAPKVAFSWPSVDRFGKNFGRLMTMMRMVKLKVYKISANLVHSELRNATFEGTSH